MKGKAVSGLMLILLLVNILLLAFKIVPVRTLATATVTYDYYVVARAHSDMMPTAPSPAPSPPGFNFTVDPPVFNFGNVTYWGGRSYLYDGFAYSPYTNRSRFGSGARVNITNLLGYDITITNLTAEVTDGTPTKEPFIFWPFFPIYNVTIVTVDTLDAGDYDECNYTTGMVEVHRLVDGDRYNKITGEPALGYANQGPGSLLENDTVGDAATTGHVAPIPIAAGETFTEYFGVIILGDVDYGTQINGTIRLALTFEFIPPPIVPIPSFTYIPSNPLINEIVTFNASNSKPNGGNITSYKWNFGDGSTGSGIIINHTYTTLGTYTVVLNVTDTEGTWFTASHVMNVGELPSDADEFPWLWVGVAVVAVAVVVAVAAFLVRRRK